MKLVKRIKFALKYDIEPEFIVAPFGKPTFEIIRFLKYEDAKDFAEQQPMQYGRPSIMVIIRKDKE